MGYCDANMRNFLVAPYTGIVKGCVRYIFITLFCMSKREHLQNEEKCFLFQKLFLLLR